MGVSSDPIVFVTGYPGFIGKRLVRELMATARQRGMRIVLLVQPAYARACRAEFQESGDTEVLEGDVMQIHLGLSGAEWKRLTASVVEIWHLAAVSNLRSELDRFRTVNIDGTRNVLELARSSPNLARLNHFSTAYVSGDREGVILEDELQVNQRFHNPYEETKFQAEVMVQRAKRDLPITIYRPSIVVGDSRTGEIDRFDGPYTLAILLVASPLAVPLPLPGNGIAPLNVVPVDYLVSAALSISANPAAIGKTIHLVDPAPLSARRVYEIIAARAHRKVPSVSLPHRAVERLLELPILERLARPQRAAIQYVNHLAIYNCRNLLDLLSGTGIQCPPITSYLDRLIEYVQATFARRRELELATEDDPFDPLPEPPQRRKVT